ncbi:ankyrin repeat domain-containing protein 12-like isoform X5 [Leptopilina heterotoma]|uniref:ankyrin repeat domain-containing protein 12-like isoform X5 n=1 Tax=Leptopilina heterotoma TaxID=63436 RepID=UPI001CA7DBF4|nr:ankyrin repeat domain-containing protein 12-like isoform X5 [Leptopilina heterotoma]
MKRKRQLSLKSTNESREGHSTRFFYGNSQTKKSDENLTVSQSPTTSMTEQAEPRKAEKKTFRSSGIFRSKSPTRSREEMSTSSIGKTENVKAGIPEKQSFTSSERLSLKSTNESREGQSTRFFYCNSQTQKSDENLTFSSSSSTPKTEQAEPRKAEKKTFRSSGIFRLKSPTRSREEMSTSSIGKTENVKAGIPEKQSFTSSERLSLKSTNESREGQSTRFFYCNSQTQKSDENLTFTQSPTTSMTEQAEPRKAEKKTFRSSGIFRLKSPTRSREEVCVSSIGKTEDLKSGIPEKQFFSCSERLSLKSPTRSREEMSTSLIEKTEKQILSSSKGPERKISFHSQRLSLISPSDSPEKLSPCSVYRVPTETSLSLSSSTGPDLKITSSKVEKSKKQEAKFSHSASTSKRDGVDSSIESGAGPSSKRKKYSVEKSTIGVSSNRKRTSITLDNENIDKPLHHKVRRRLELMGTEKHTVKVCLGKLCKSANIKNRIEEDAKVVSSMMYEATTMALFGLYEETNVENVENCPSLLEKWTNNGPDFLSFLISLKQKVNAQRKVTEQDAKINTMVNEYKELRNDIPLYDGEHRTAIIQEAALVLNRNFKTNFTTHAASRLRRYLQLLMEIEDEEKNHMEVDEIQEICSVYHIENDNDEKIKIRSFKNSIKNEQRKEFQKSRKQFPDEMREKKTSDYCDERYVRQEKYLKHCDKVYYKKRPRRRRKKSKKEKEEEKEKNKEKEEEKEKNKEKEEEEKEKNKEEEEEKEKNKEKKKFRKRRPSFYKQSVAALNLLLQKNECQVKGFPTDLLLKKGDNDRRKLDFTKLTKDEEWHKFLPFFIMIQQEFHDKKKKNFTLIPQISLGVKHVVYTNTALKELQTATVIQEIKEKKAILQKKKRKSGTNKDHLQRAVDKMDDEMKRLREMNNEERWNSMFNFKSIQRGRKKLKNGGKFSGTITTNGVDVSVIFDLPTKHDVVQSKKKVGSYKKFCGFDPGARATLAGVSRENDPNPTTNVKKDSAIYIGSWMMRWQMGDYRRRELMKKKGIDMQKYYKQLAEDPLMENFCMTNPRDRHRITKYRIHLLQNFQSLHQKRSVTRLRIDRYSAQKRQVDQLVNWIVGDTKKKPCFVAIGGAEIPNFIKGYTKAPLKRIQQTLFQRSEELGKDKLQVVKVNEFNTTKMCSRCVRPLKISKSPHRYTYCAKCKTTWERDVNAGRNILNLALVQEKIIPKDSIKNHHLFRIKNDDIEHEAAELQK